MLNYASDSNQYEEKVDNYMPGPPWYHVVLLNRPLKVITVFLLLAVLAPALIYHFLFFNSGESLPSDGFSAGSCLVSRNNRLPCGFGHMNASDCHPHCCYDLYSSFCYHRFPSRFSFIGNRDMSEMLQPRIPTVPFGQNSLTQIRLTIDEISSTHLSIAFHNPEDLTVEGNTLDVKNYTYEISSPEIQVVVNGTNGTIFNTARGPLIASNNIWEISFVLSNETLYGLGEIPLMEGTTKVLYNHHDGLSSLPLIFAKSFDTYHGMLIDIKDPTEVSIHGGNQIVVRSITTSGFKFHIFVGPSPKDIMEDVMDLIGFRNELEYWMLGAHVCSHLSESTNTPKEDLNTFLEEAESANLPYESHCGIGPIALSDDKCERVDVEVDIGASAVRESGKRYVPLVSPYLHYEYPVPEIEDTTSEENDHCTYKQENNNCSIASLYKNYILQTMHTKCTEDNITEKLGFYKGLINDETVIYPYYENVTEEFMQQIWKYTAKLDGVILNDAWPLDESLKNHNDTFDILPYFNKNFAAAFNFTPQWNTTLSNGKTYIYHHNDYGNFFANAFKNISGDTPMWVTSNHMNDFIVNRQNIDTSWTNLHRELIQAALGGVSGQWLWSSPICGDTKNFDRTRQIPLCVKWYMAAAFMPMIKIHSKDVRRDPLSFTGRNKADIMGALNKRLRLMPYFYTTLQKGPLLRPMFYQYPLSANLTNINTQFSVGDDLIVVPNLQPSQFRVHFWMPPGQWYEMWSGLPLVGPEGVPIVMMTIESDLLTLIRGGSIIAMQDNIQKNGSAADSRLSDFSLKIALHCETIETETSNTTTDCRGQGTLYMSKDTSLHFDADATEVRITLEGDSSPFCGKASQTWGSDLKEIDIFGLDPECNNMDHHKILRFTPSVSLCQLENINQIVLQYCTRPSNR